MWSAVCSLRIMADRLRGEKIPHGGGSRNSASPTTAPCASWQSGQKLRRTWGNRASFVPNTTERRHASSVFQQRRSARGARRAGRTSALFADVQILGIDLFHPPDGLR
jgi:hypothetical protein